jgi:hypothetical protein
MDITGQAQNESPPNAHALRLMDRPKQQNDRQKVRHPCRIAQKPYVFQHVEQQGREQAQHNEQGLGW